MGRLEVGNETMRDQVWGWMEGNSTERDDWKEGYLGSR